MQAGDLFVRYPVRGAQVILGLALLTESRRGEAIEALDKSIALDAGYAEAYRTRGLAYVMEGKFDKAVDDLRAASTLDEYPIGAVEGMDTVAAIADRLGAYGASIRAAIENALELDDQDTADLFIGVSRSIDKHLWFVEAHLQA